MRYFRLSAILVIVLFVFTSCGWEKVKEENKLLNEAKEETSVFFEYLKNEDIESLSNLFSKNKKDTHNLNEEWKSFFEEIDGKITDYDKMAFTETLKNVSKGEITYLVIQAEFKNVKTDTGQVYSEMEYSKIIKSNHDNSSEGIATFTLWKEADKYDNPFIIGGNDSKLKEQNSNS